MSDKGVIAKPRGLRPHILTRRTDLPAHNPLRHSLTAFAPCAIAARENGKKGGRPKSSRNKNGQKSMRRKLTAKDVTVTHEPPDGWWIDLPFGWVMDDGSHGIAEDTKRAALAKLSLAQPCNCKRCSAMEK